MAGKIQSSAPELMELASEPTHIQDMSGVTPGKELENVCAQTDRASAALVKDLKQQGLLDDTLVIWGGEFGRTPMEESRASKIGGRDHFIDAYPMWLAGGGIKPGTVYGETDELVHDILA